MNKLVVKHNSLIDASFNLSLIEQRIMLLAIVEGRELPELTSNTPIEIKATAYKEQYNVDDSEAYKQLKNAGKTLKRREFTYLDVYQDVPAYSTVGWINKITYVPSKGMIVLKLSDEVIELITRLESHFTRYHLNQVSGLSSKYSIRLYELVLKWISNGKTQRYEISDLREKLGILDRQYKSVSYLKRDVLDKCLEEINLKTNLIISFETFKEGRVITHIQFKMKTKDEPKQQNKKVQLLTPKQIDMFSDKLSNLESFQRHFVADVGQSSEDYSKKIASKLQDTFYQNEWLPFMLEAGFTPK